jgi:hypothetical protein
MRQKKLNPQPQERQGAREISSSENKRDLPTTSENSRPTAPLTQSADGEAPAMVAVDFLERLRPGGPWVLTAIQPDGPTETITARDANAVCDFVLAHNGMRNLYYSVNPTRRAMTSKAAKTDIAAVEYLLADLDPRENESPNDAKARYLEALETHAPAATAIIDSGNGVQVLWRLMEPINLSPPMLIDDGKKVLSPETAAVVDDVEGRVKALMLTLGSVAGTQNVDRILRLPGTINLPNRKKANAGRVACPTKLIRFNGATHPLAAFPTAARDTKSKSRQDKPSKIDALPIPQRIKNLIRGVDDPDHPYESRSEAVFAVILAMVSGGCANDQIEAVFLDSSWPISAHVLEQIPPPKYLARQIDKARKMAVDPRIAKLNEAYALVIVGDKTAIMKLAVDGAIKFLTHGAFELWHANRYIFYQDKKGGQKKMSLAKHWLHHPQRRQYEGIVFAPGREVPNHFNLWRGFGVESRPGDCSRFLAHLRHNVCRGDEDLFNWLVGWLAQIVQQPDKKMGTSVVIRGKQGTGKTKVGQVFGSLLGEHYAPVSDPRYVTGPLGAAACGPGRTLPTPPVSPWQPMAGPWWPSSPGPNLGQPILPNFFLSGLVSGHRLYIQLVLVYITLNFIYNLLHGRWEAKFRVNKG